MPNDPRHGSIGPSSAIFLNPPCGSLYRCIPREVLFSSIAQKEKARADCRVSNDGQGSPSEWELERRGRVAAP